MAINIALGEWFAQNITTKGLPPVSKGEKENQCYTKLSSCWGLAIIGLGNLNWDRPGHHRKGEDLLGGDCDDGNDDDDDDGNDDDDDDDCDDDDENSDNYEFLLLFFSLNKAGFNF